MDRHDEALRQACGGSIDDPADLQIGRGLQSTDPVSGHHPLKNFARQMPGEILSGDDGI
jgi:hypothetical protein